MVKPIYRLIPYISVRVIALVILYFRNFLSYDLDASYRCDIRIL